MNEALLKKDSGGNRGSDNSINGGNPDEFDSPKGNQPIVFQPQDQNMLKNLQNQDQIQYDYVDHDEEQKLQQKIKPAGEINQQNEELKQGYEYQIYDQDEEMMKFFEENYQSPSSENQIRQTLSKGILQIMSRRLSEMNGAQKDEVKQEANIFDTLEIISEQELLKDEGEEESMQDANYWPQDAKNGLSYSKMKYVIETRHPRRVRKGKRIPYSWCGSNTGWHCVCKSCKHSDLREMGVGVTVYFKMLKFLMILFLWFSFLSLPAYLFYYNGNEVSYDKLTLKYFLSAFSLGNIGQASNTCNYGDIRLQEKINFFCSYGQLERIYVYGLSTKNSQCPSDFSQDLDVDSKCNFQGMGNKYESQLNDRFENECSGKNQCQFQLLKTDFNAQCNQEIDKRALDPSGLKPQIYAEALCQNLQVPIPFTKYKIERSYLAVVIVVFDILIILSYIMAISILEKYEKEEDKFVNRKSLKTEDFSVSIKKLPPSAGFKNLKEYKALLWDHLENVVAREKQVITRLEGQQQDNVNFKEIVNIYFGMTSYSNMKILLEVYNDIKELVFLETKMKKDKKKRKKSYIRKIEKKNTVIDIKLRLIKDLKLNEQDKTNKIVNAYVVFRSMEGRQRALQAYEDGYLTRLFGKYLCCKYWDYKQKKFLDKWIKVKPAKSPDIILWQNLKVGNCQRFGRIMIITFVTLILMIITFLILIIAKKFENQAEEYSPQIDCPDTEVSQQDAYLDQQKDAVNRIGLMHCYCLNQFYKINIGVKDIQFQDGKEYCNDWLKKYTLANSFVFIVAFGIAVINIIGIVIFVVNVDFGLNFSAIPVFQGKYKEFTVEWYRVVGTTISEYENVNTGSEFLMEFRYSSILAQLYIILMYSPGMPLLYLIAFASFFLTYWFDKFFLLKCYRKPPSHTIDLSSSTVSLMYYALVFHFIIGLYMYSNITILTPTDFINDLFDYITFDTVTFDLRRFQNWHCVLFIMTFGLIFTAFLIRNTFFRLMCCFCRICKKQYKYNDKYDVISDDYLKELNFMQLFKEFKRTRQEVLDYQEDLNAGKINEKVRPAVIKHIARLDHKIVEINKVFLELFQKYGIINPEEDGKQMTDFGKAFQIALRKTMAVKVQNRLQSAICTYDIQDNDFYNGVYEVENYIRSKEKQQQVNEQQHLLEEDEQKAQP
ncbi:UNKNOWN [Stylonychia lemnae]|uniref:CSC1/OSCA1-like cytosolic domain-containing protein n=1 Tax=Stylonychia lemnae TaxID=5949 RepID=A0A077ZXH3_STYLE|nr:UNKNOWN [Stylonychia lemnae]|eukprot:CDW73927.1 UNKNOWN [Stylonychia lemnae]